MATLLPLGGGVLVLMIVVASNLERIRQSPIGKHMAIVFFVALLLFSPVIGVWIVFGSVQAIEEFVGQIGSWRY